MKKRVAVVREIVLKYLAYFNGIVVGSTGGSIKPESPVFFGRIYFQIRIFGSPPFTVER